MAARLHKRHSDEIRLKIQASQLVNRLQNTALGKDTMTKEEIMCARALLNKSVPDLKAVEHSGPDGADLKIGLVQF